MAQDSKIEWTDTTWNPVVGCSKVSPGCAHCYAEKMAKRLRAMAMADIAAGKNPGKKKHYIDAVDGQGRWTGNLVPVPEALGDPYRWQKPRKIFVNSMSDLFHPHVSFGFVLRVMEVIAQTPRHTYQILTKHPDRAAEFFGMWCDLEGEDLGGFKNARGPREVRAAHPSGRGELFAQMLESMGDPPAGCAYPTFDWMEGMIGWGTKWGNLMLGTSCERQQEADERIPHLLQCGDVCAVKFLSCEPLLDSVRISKWVDLCPQSNRIDRKHGFVFDGDDPYTVCQWCGERRDAISGKAVSGRHTINPIDWVIAGGESGPKARPMHPDWARSLRDQCVAAGVPFFFKQWGEWAPYENDAQPPFMCGQDGGWIDGHHLPEHLTDRINERVLNWMMTDDCQVYRHVGKKAAGRKLDGREWNEMPSLAS